MVDEIVMAIKNGNNDLMEMLWLQLEKLIIWYAKKYYASWSACGAVPGGVEIKDLVQCGYFGLLETIQHYQPEQGASFTTFLLWYLKKAFQECIGRTKRRWNDPLNHCLSLDAPINDDDDTTYLDFVDETFSNGKDDFVHVEDRIFTEQLHVALEDALNRLPANQAETLRGEFFKGLTQEEIAAEIGCSAKYVHQLKRQALNGIRYSSSRTNLERFIDFQTDFYRGSVSRRGVENKAIMREELRKKYRDGIDYVGLESGHVYFKNESEIEK